MANSGKNFPFAPGNTANLRVFIPEGLNVLLTTGSMVADSALNRASAGLPVTEVYSGNYTFDIPDASPPFYSSSWKVFLLNAPPTFAGPGSLDRVIYDGAGDPISWGGLAPIPQGGAASGHYIAQSQIEARYGVGNVASNSNWATDASTAANVATVQDAIDQAERTADSVLSVRYVTPLATSSRDIGYIRDWCIDYTYLLLIQRRVYYATIEMMVQIGNLLEEAESDLSMWMMTKAIDATLRITGESNAPYAGDTNQDLEGTLIVNLTTGAWGIK